jgi:hypothetical protein
VGPRKKWQRVQKGFDWFLGALAGMQPSAAGIQPCFWDIQPSGRAISALDGAISAQFRESHSGKSDVVVAVRHDN